MHILQQDVGVDSNVLHLFFTHHCDVLLLFHFCHNCVQVFRIAIVSLKLQHWWEKLKELKVRSHQTQTSTIVYDSVLEKSMVNKHCLLNLTGTCGCLMGCTLEYRSSSLGSSPDQGHCVVFLGKTLNSHVASLHPGQPDWRLAGRPAMDYEPIQEQQQYIHVLLAISCYKKQS